MRYFMFSFLILLSACSSNSTAEQLSQQIANTENQIGANPQSSDDEVKALLLLYDTYAAYPDADAQMSVDYMLRAGDMAARLKDFGRTLGYYDTVLEKYPDNPKAPKALFMKGFTLDNKMGKLEEARTVYEQFLAKYPNDDFANDAEFSLKNLGKSAEEIIEGFESQKAGEN